MDIDEFYLWRGYHHQVPAFGSWDYYNNDLPFTQCFESAATKQKTVMKGQIRDHVWMVQCDESDDDDDEFKVARRRSPRVVNAVNNSTKKCKPKAVDEDLYKISPHLMRQVLSKRKKTWGFFYSCLKPACLC